MADIKTYGIGWQDDKGWYTKVSLPLHELVALAKEHPELLEGKYGNIRLELCKYKVPNKDRGNATHYFKLDEYHYQKKGILQQSAPAQQKNPDFFPKDQENNVIEDDSDPSKPEPNF